MSNVKGGESVSSATTLLDNTVISRIKHPLKTNYKIVVSGKIFEVYYFTNHIWVQTDRPKKPLSQPMMMDILIHPENYHKKSDRSEEYKNRTINRAKTRMRRLVQANFDTAGKFLSLTFQNTDAFDITSLTECHQRFAIFTKKLRQKYPDIKYIAVPEFQKRGAVHYHLILDLPFVPIQELRELWRYGFLKVNRINNPASVGVYIAKYIGKALKDPRYKGHRCFYSSKNLKQPMVKYGNQLEEFVESLTQKGFTPSFSSEYENKWTGKILYRSYNLYQPPAQKEKDG